MEHLSRTELEGIIWSLLEIAGQLNNALVDDSEEIDVDGVNERLIGVWDRVHGNADDESDGTALFEI